MLINKEIYIIFLTSNISIFFANMIIFITFSILQIHYHLFIAGLIEELFIILCHFKILFNQYCIINLPNNILFQTNASIRIILIHARHLFVIILYK